MRAFLVGLCLLATCLPVVAQEMFRAPLTACDTKEQIQEYIENGEDAAALEKVNAKHGPDACINNTFAFLKGQDANTFGNWTVLRILIVGVLTDDGFAKVPPLPQWTAYRTPGRGV